MTQAAIEVRDLCQGYRNHPVLHQLNLTVPRGATYALLGRNGAGKTTLIRTLLGLLSAQSGTVSVLEIDPALHAIEVRRRIGYLAEDQSMYGWMTASELAGFLRPFYPTWDTVLAEQLLQRFEVPRRQPIRQFSQGQTIRLALALALAHRPELVILDDPALGLDPVTRKQFNRDVIEHLQAEGRTVFYSSHLLYEVEAVADAVAILDAGRVVRSGPTETLQRDVQRVVLPVEELHTLPRPDKLLDVSVQGGRAAATLDEASPWLETLDRKQVRYTPEILSLDEIFEAFVIGRTEAWPSVRDSYSAAMV